MAYVLTNGTYYIKMTETGGVAKTDSIKEARVYLTTEKAKERKQKAPGKTKGYYIMEIETESRYYVSNGRIRYPKEIRELIYHKADGRCALCGRKVMMADATLDHITPLSLGGEDCKSNLQLTCKVCNGAKDSYLPEDFQDRVFDTFCFQMEKKCGNSLKWKMIHKALMGML